MNYSEASSIAECPSSPNCVSSQSKSSSHKIEALSFQGSMDDFHTFAKKIKDHFPRTEIVKIEGPYVHLVTASFIFRFKDDIELYYSESESLIHIRSASRVGYSDLGVNRRRAEEIKELLK